VTDAGSLGRRRAANAIVDDRIVSTTEWKDAAMTNEEIAAVLAKPYAQRLLSGAEPARMAYIGVDGDPRAIPIGFWTEGERIVMATASRSAKVAALRMHPNVALTIDTSAFPPKVLLIRGIATVEVVTGVPEGYLLAGHKVMTDDQYPGWVAGVTGLYDEMGVITVTPTWAKLLDFETTLPKAVEDLIAAKAAG
jgi:pyridoxamine 5'-phosphate oxidase-like protein